MIGQISALAAALCWTFSAIMYRKAMMTTKPFPANVLRCTSTGIALLAFLALIGKFNALTQLPTQVTIIAGISGIIGLGFGDTLYFLGLKLIGVARSVPITCTYPLFSILIAVFLQGETATLSIVAGALAIVLGIWLLTREEKYGENQLSKTTLIKGTAVSLATAVLWAISISMIDVAVTTSETNNFDSALAVNTVRTATVALSLLISSLLTDHEHHFLRIKRETAITLFSAGIIAMAVGWFLLAFSFQNIPEVQAVPISSTTPLFTSMFGMAFLHERVTAKSLIGSFAIVAGIFLVFLI